MKTPFPADVTTDSVFVWLMHRISEVFKDHAVLKGGMALRLVNCPRSTNDLDYVFVPYSSKKEIMAELGALLEEIPNATIEKSVNSRAARIIIKIENISLQIEATVSKECRSTAMSTVALAKGVNQLGKIIRIMSFDVALSHKLAAWNERRLARDIYDIYYIFDIIGEKPDIETLKARLAKMESRIPRLKNTKRMSLQDFIDVLRKEAAEISSESLRQELAGLFDESELTGLDVKIRAALNKLASYMAGAMQKI